MGDQGSRQRGSDGVCRVRKQASEWIVVSRVFEVLRGRRDPHLVRALRMCNGRIQCTVAVTTLCGAKKMDVVSKSRRSELMSRIGDKDTRPETIVRRLLHAMGFRFRLHRRDLPGCPDIVLPQFDTVVFVHGCFWHGHSCSRGKRPLSNQGFWDQKLDRNIARDRNVQCSLRLMGWKVVTVWECQTRDERRLTERLSRIRNQT